MSGCLPHRTDQFNNIDSGVWVNYHEADWDQRPWLQKCGGCHATGVDLDKETFRAGRRLRVSLPRSRSHPCRFARHRDFREAYHHRQSKQAYRWCRHPDLRLLPQPRKLDQIQRQASAGRLQAGQGAGNPISNRLNWVTSTSTKRVSKGHHQQYIDWTKSKHADSGVSCVSCHVVHQLGNPLFQQDQSRGDQLCVSCHEQTAKSRFPFGPLVRQLRQPSHAEDRQERRVGRHPQPRVYGAAAEGHHRDQGPELLPGLSSIENDDLADLQQRWDALTKRAACRRRDDRAKTVT